MKLFKKDIISYDSRRPVISEKLVGGKAKNLFYLYRKGFDIPCWIVITSEVFRRCSEDISDSILSLIKTVNFENQTSIEATSREIRRLIMNLHISPELTDDLKKRIQIKLGVAGKYSVRSSIIGEDSDSNSFAGQMDSYLNVSYGNIIETIRKVWASAYSSRALIYRHQKGISLSSVAAAVIIQRMVDVKCSGVMFTCSPQTGAKEINVSAGFGLGEGIVQNLVETDTYRIDWDSEDITRDIKAKKLRVVGNDEHGTCLQLLENDLRTASVLTDHEVILLYKIGKDIERHYGHPQDIEWSFDREGKLYILQSRPVIIQTIHHSQYRIWDNSNIVESYPGLTLPLTFSFIQQGYEIAFKKASLGCLLLKKEIQEELHIFKNMIGLLDGRVYYNLLNWYKMLSYLPGFKNHKISWDRMIGIGHKCSFPRTKLSFPNRLFSIAVIVFRLLAVRYNARVFFRKFNASYNKYRDIKFSSLCEGELVDMYHAIEHDFSQIWHRTLYNDFCAMKYYGWLKKLCRQDGLDKYPNLHNNLLCGEPDIESVKPVHTLLELADEVKRDPGFEALFRNESNHDIWISIITDSRYTILRDKLSIYIRNYGDRSLEELKLETPTYRNNPEGLIQLIKDYAGMPLTAKLMHQREQLIRKSAEKAVCENVRNPFKRLVFFLVLDKTRRAIGNRENMRFARSRLYGIIKNLFRRMAKLFTEHVILEKPKDIYYLTVSEVFSYVQGSSVNQNLKSIVEMRKKDYMLFRNRNPKDRIYHSGLPYLSGFGDEKENGSRAKILKGIGCSSGAIKGTARVVKDPHEIINEKDYILIAKSTDPGWVFLMLQSKGIVVEKGSVLSHTAIIGRELGIPTVVAVDNATTSIKTGDIIHIDGSTGVVRCA